jgi:hypothetical protein
MAIKIKKRRVEPEEAPVVDVEPTAPEEPVTTEALLTADPEIQDAVLDNSRTAVSWLIDHRNIVFGAVAVFLVGAAGFSILSASRATAQVGAAQQLYAVVDMAAADGSGGESLYESIAARESSVRAAAEALAATPVTGIADRARLLAARGALAGGDSAAALAAVNATADMTGPEGVIRSVALATSQAESGDLPGALATLDAATAPDSSLAVGVARVKARLIDGHGAPAEALEAYRGFVQQWPTSSDLDAINNRIAQLEMELGVEPIEGSGEATDTP